MWQYEKALQYPVRIKNPNPALARCIITQFGGPDGELGAANRYLSQRYTMPYGEVRGILTDVGTDGAKTDLSEPMRRRISARDSSTERHFPGSHGDSCGTFPIAPHPRVSCQ